MVRLLALILAPWQHSSESLLCANRVAGAAVGRQPRSGSPCPPCSRPISFCAEDLPAKTRAPVQIIREIKTGGRSTC